MLPSYTSLIFIVVSLASAQALKCQEGVNATFGTIPFYQWTERDCDVNSACFSQELSQPFMKDLKLTVQYGGCISSPYASLITCENLFGPESNFNPAVLLNMITELDDMVDDMVEDFQVDAAKQMKMLFSNGRGSEQFIGGIYKYMEALGFNMEKAEPLKAPIAKLFSAVFFDSDKGVDQFLADLQAAKDKVLNELGSLDTKNPAIAENIFSYLQNYNAYRSPKDMERLKARPEAVLITNLPGLVKSILPDSWEADKWYDVIFDILGDVKFTSPQQTATDVIKTIKSAADIPESYKKYLNPIFDTIPNLVQQMFRGNFNYALIWSIDLLEAESSVNENTTRLTNAITSFMTKISDPSTSINPQIYRLIKWLPGLFYNFFPADKDEIGRVYVELAAGFDSINFQAPTTTLEETELSKFIQIILNALPTGPPGPESDATKAMLKQITINFSKTFYNLMTSKRKKDLDTFFSTLKDGFQNFPNVDAGKIIVNLVTNMGDTVPTEIEPILNNAQNVINAISGVSGQNASVYNSLQTLVNDYKTKYPDSEFPVIFGKAITSFRKRFEKSPQYTCHQLYERGESLTSLLPADIDKCNKEYIKKIATAQRMFSDEMDDLSVDLYFAMFDLGDENPGVRPYLFPMTIDFQEPYISMIRLLDRQDVKDLVRDYNTWYYSMHGDPSLKNFDSFIHAVNATVYKISTKLRGAMKDLREFHRPQSCKYTSCNEDLCNTHERLGNVVPFTKAIKQKQRGEEQLTTPSVTTTSGCGNPFSSILLNIATLLLVYKTLSE